MKSNDYTIIKRKNNLKGMKVFELVRVSTLLEENRNMCLDL